MQDQTWSIADLFEVADQEQKGYISVYDFQVILSHSKQKSSNMEDLAYLLRMYDTNGSRRVTFQDFKEQVVVKAN